MNTQDSLLTACFGADPAAALATAREQHLLWEKWLLPISTGAPEGGDLSYDERFEQMRDEVNMLSGADTALICANAEALLTTGSKDVRVVAWYAWARLQQDGETGLADGLTLLTALVMRYGEALYPQRATRRKTAIEWLCGSKIQTTLTRYPEVDDRVGKQMAAQLALLTQAFSQWDVACQPSLSGLATLLETRLTQSGALLPGGDARVSMPAHPPALPVGDEIRSGRDLLDQGKNLTHYLRDQPQGGLAAARVMRSLRWDTVHQAPPQDASGNTRLAPPRTESRATLKRLYLQQDWTGLLEQAERDFAEGANHFWLDVQWYVCQALAKSPHPLPAWGDILRRDLGMWLERLPGLERQSYHDGTPFADEVTLSWIAQHVSGNQQNAALIPLSPGPAENQDILALEAEALSLADSDGLEAALNWLAQHPGVISLKQRWLQRLLMARVAEQCGKNDMALHLFDELNRHPAALNLADWEPDLLFEVRARLLKMLRLKQQRSDGDRQAIQQQMDTLLAGLIAIDPARAAVLC